MNELEQVEILMLRELNKRINIFSKLLKDELGIDLSNLDVDKLNSVKRRIPQLIKKAGLEKVYDDIIYLFDNIDPFVNKEIARTSGISLDEINKAIINKAEVFAELELEEDLDKINKDLARRMRKKLKVRQLKKMNDKERNALINSLVNVTKNQTKSAVVTNVMGYDRMVTTLTANEVGLDKFRYAGQNDSRNRKFCKKRVGKIYTDSESEKWSNGQKEPASIYLGGYRCRHRKEYIVI